MRHHARSHKSACASLCLLGVMVAASAGAAEGGIPSAVAEPKPIILLGMSTALTGPTAYLGLTMRAGVLAALQEVNRNGGIRGTELGLISLDDQYEPSLTAPNMRKLTEESKVLAVVGNIGTPTALAAIPIAIETRTPFWGACTGAAVLRKAPPDRYVFNFRASYVEEATAMLDAAVDKAGIRPEQVALFTQRDAFGDAVFGAAMKILRRKGLGEDQRILHARYTRNSLAVENAVADLLLHEPEPRAVILVATPAPAAEFVRIARANGCDALLFGMSFVGAERFAEGLGADAEGTVFAQVVPDCETELPIAADYRNAMERYDPQAPLTATSFEGYIATRIFCRALDSIRGNYTGEAVVEALEGMGRFDIGLDVPLFLGPEEHQACHTVWPTIIHNGKVRPLDWDELSLEDRR